MKRQSDNWLYLCMAAMLLWLVSCTVSQPAQPTERARSIQYQMKFIGSDCLTYRNGKLINRQPSGIFTNDTVRTEIKTTTEKY